MIVNKTVDLGFDAPEARRLADLYGISVDLEAVQGYCQLIVDLMIQQQPDFRLLEGLWLAAIIRYARCFTNNRPVRSSLGQKDLRPLPETLKQTHKFFLELRNKHVARSESPLEQNRVGVDLDIREASSPSRSIPW